MRYNAKPIGYQHFPAYRPGGEGGATPGSYFIIDIILPTDRAVITVIGIGDSVKVNDTIYPLINGKAEIYNLPSGVYTIQIGDDKRTINWTNPGWPKTSLVVEFDGGSVVEVPNYVVTSGAQIKTQYPTAKRIWSAGELSDSVTDLSNAFKSMSNLEYADMTSWDTSAVTNMYEIFYNCQQATFIDVSNWNTSSVTNMYALFGYCAILPFIDVSNWDTSSVTIMTSMFVRCNIITSIDVSNWDTSAVTNMTNMFNNCGRLTSISNWKSNTINVSLSTAESQLDFSSVMTLLNACSETPVSGATMTFNSSIYAGFSDEQKAIIQSVKTPLVEAGWTITNLG